ncbi:hypothetical protein TYRP_007167 [Tyrophagus putrescentiae]|nr:hypothetical protein TYRP_007167 [Tyrophagus putrescentiae]
MDSRRRKEGKLATLCEGAATAAVEIGLLTPSDLLPVAVRSVALQRPLGNTYSGGDVVCLACSGGGGVLLASGYIVTCSGEDTLLGHLLGTWPPPCSKCEPSESQM